jgi:hypothetical protein
MDRRIRSRGSIRRGVQRMNKQDTEAGVNGARGAARLSDPLGSAADTWLRRGYQRRYQDNHLVQLAAPVEGPTSRDLLLTFGVGALGGIASALGVLAYFHLTRRGRWHVVSLLLTPERRVMTHQQWQAVPSDAR